MKKPTATDTTRNGGLPEDDGSLDGFALPAAAAAAFAPAARRRPPTAEPSAPTQSGGAEPTPAAASVVQEAPAPTAPQVSPATLVGLPAPMQPAVSPAAHSRAQSHDPLPCLIMVDWDVRRRFEHYQTAQKLAAGHEPTNAVVIRRAFLHAQRHDLFQQLRENARHQQHPVSEEDLDPAGLFGDVPARREQRGRVKSRTQQSFRPSGRELAVYDGYATAYTFDNRSDFLNALLDAFLPPLANRRPSR